MTRTPSRGPVTRSALGWLQRLGWQYLAPNRRCALHGTRGSPVLEGRLRQHLQQVRVEVDGQYWPLDAGGIARVLAAVLQGVQRRGAQAGNDALLAVLRDGVCVELLLPDGRTVQATVPLIDWHQPLNNLWDMAGARDEGQPALDAVPRVDALVGYVNGVPLLHLLCVERDGQGRWGRDDTAIALHHGQPRASGNACCAPMLLALDRRGGRYAASGAPASGWMRWREHGWTTDTTQQLRRTEPTPKTGARDAGGRCLQAVHAPLLAGVAAPARLLALLHGFVHSGADGRQRIARAAQFFAVQAGLERLRYIDAQGRRGGGQLQLAAGTGMTLARHWLLQHLRGDPWLRRCRVLRVQQRTAGHAPCEARGGTGLSPGRQLAAFMADGRGTTLHTTPGTLQAWLRRRDAGYAADDLIVLLDAHLQANPPAWLQRARQRLPRAGWLWLGSGPLPTAAPLAQGDPLLFACTNADAIADGLVVPVYPHGLGSTRLRRTLAKPGAKAVIGASAPRSGCWAAAIAQHLRDTLQYTDRHLRALLLVANAEAMRQYQRAFAKDGTVHSAMVGPGAGRASAAQQQAQLLIATDPHALPYLDARLALVYLGAALDGPARARAVALVNRPHPHKHCAWFVNLPGVAGVGVDGTADGWAPLSLQQLQAGLPRLHRRLRALLPPTGCADFHACGDHLGPCWHVDARGQQRDLHRLRRRCLHQRVTGFGQQLQAAMLALPGDGGMAEADTPQWRYRYDLHFCSLLRDAAGKEACEEHLSGSEDVRIRHWARERAPEVRDGEVEYVGPGATQPANPRREADVLHSQLRHQLETSTAWRAAHLQLQRQLQAFLVTPGSSAHRLRQLQALQAVQLLRARALALPVAGGASPLQLACRSALVHTLGTPKNAAQRQLHHALAEQLTSAIGSAHAAQPCATHLVVADLQRRLAPALASLLSPAHCQALLAQLPALLAGNTI
ncbi:hypothetical protein KQ945_05955 [Bacillus subtilis subsp. subtilis]|nr:hypothetical protein [Bacillus subtilis subsp. subtilis]